MFQKATRTKTPLKVALQGPSGSGKTMGALLIAYGLHPGGKIAVLDTENGSASLYSDRFNFDTVTLLPPYTSQRYIEVIAAAEKAGYDCLVIDSISHQWMGVGGILDRKEQKDRQGGNSYTNWKFFTDEHESFKDRIRNSPMDIIVTMRSKSDYVMETNANGKQQPKKVGLKAEQREGTEFEYSVVFELGMNHYYTVGKDRTSLFDAPDMAGQISEETGRMLREWRNSAAPAKAQATVPADETPGKTALTPEIKAKMLEAVSDGKGDLVLDRLNKYEVSGADWKEIVLAIQRHEDEQTPKQGKPAESSESPAPEITPAENVTQALSGANQVNEPTNTAQHESEQPKEGKKPWLTELQFKAMMDGIMEGKADYVLGRMDNYQIRRDYREKLNEAIANAMQAGPADTPEMREAQINSIKGLMSVPGVTQDFRKQVLAETEGLNAAELKALAKALPARIKEAKKAASTTAPA